ncbi:DNA repair and recombination protein RadB [Thermoplasmatales archaeon SG8-52-4]|nr:MAG: DNA repair and recombination protein RadB [Thermoplasmatales archaeon SG8-52-4]
MKHLQLRCKPIDDLLGGGIESKSITEIYGEPGTGKTNLCLQASRECSNLGKKVAFIDSQGVSSERFKQICGDSDCKNVLSNILFFNPSSFKEQEKMIKTAINLENLGLIILDTYNSFYRLMIENDEKYADRSLNRQITELQIASVKKNIYVIITGQVYSTENNDVRPFGGRSIEHMLKTIIKLEKISKGKRQATIIKHQNKVKGKKAIFSITSKGLE